MSSVDYNMEDSHILSARIPEEMDGARLDAILGTLFLGELPQAMSFIGYVIIIGVAVLRWRYNLKNED